VRLGGPSEAEMKARKEALEDAISSTDAAIAEGGRYVDLVEAGIIDAPKVARIALENAASVAGMLLLAEATLTRDPGA
jgi:chaperonin GroEL (HSP60 family)